MLLITLTSFLIKLSFSHALLTGVTTLHYHYRESVKPLQFFCGVLPVSHFVHQRKLLFWKSVFV